MSLSSNHLRATFRPVPVAPAPDMSKSGPDKSQPQNIDALAEALKAKIGTSCVKAVEKAHKGDPFVVVDGSKVVEIFKFLRDDAKFSCTLLECISAVDYPPKTEQLPAAAEGQTPPPPKEIPGRIEVVYSIWSYTHKHQFNLKVFLDREHPKVPSIVDVYRCANWYERECYDMIGVFFENHPDLQRVLLPPDWVGHPLRKDYVFPEEYNGMKVPL